MEEKVVLLTGASSGIGAHTVQFLVEKKGYRRLAIVARTQVLRIIKSQSCFISCGLTSKLLRGVYPYLRSSNIISVVR